MTVMIERPVPFPIVMHGDDRKPHDESEDAGQIDEHVVVQGALKHGAIDGRVEQHAETTDDEDGSDQLGQKMRPFHG